MKVKLTKKKGPKVEVIEIRDDFIRLDSLLKFANVVESGGEAKLRITEGEIIVNGQVCTMRGKKIRKGDIVRYLGGAMTVKHISESSDDC